MEIGEALQVLDVVSFSAIPVNNEKEHSEKRKGRQNSPVLCFVVLKSTVQYNFVGLHLSVQTVITLSMSCVPLALLALESEGKAQIFHLGGQAVEFNSWQQEGATFPRVYV